MLMIVVLSDWSALDGEQLKSTFIVAKNHTSKKTLLTISPLKYSITRAYWLFLLEIQRNTP